MKRMKGYAMDGNCFICGKPYMKRGGGMLGYYDTEIIGNWWTFEVAVKYKCAMCVEKEIEDDKKLQDSITWED